MLCKGKGGGMKNFLIGLLIWFLSCPVLIYFLWAVASLLVGNWLPISPFEWVGIVRIGVGVWILAITFIIVYALIEMA